MRINRPYNYRFDAQMNPIGHKIEAAGKPMRTKQHVPAHMTPEAAAICLNCTKKRCTGDCTRASGEGTTNWEYKGQQYKLRELAEMADLPVQTIYSRLKKGMTIEEAVDTPKEKRGRKRKNGQG